MKDDRRHNDKTKQNHKYTLRRYVLWHIGEIKCDRAKHDLPIPSEEDVRAQYLRRDIEVPDVATVKDYFRFLYCDQHSEIRRHIYYRLDMQHC